MQVQTSWGMTELSPLGTIAPPGARWSDEQASGRPPMGLDLKLTDADGATLPQQRGVVGHLKVKGASVVDRYYKAEADALDAEGYFDTGDLASIDDGGQPDDLRALEGPDQVRRRMDQSRRRSRTSSAAIPAVRLVAVVGTADRKMGRAPGARSSSCARAESLRRRTSCWAACAARSPTGGFPDQVVQIESMPLAATGKIDKNRLRADYATGNRTERAID